MKWSEDGSEVTLSAAEYAEQTAAFSVARAKVAEAQAYAVTCNDQLNEALKKDANLRYTNDLKSSSDRKSVAQAEVVSAARSFFATMMTAFSLIPHPDDCPCSVCNCSKERKALDAQAKKAYNGDAPKFTPIIHAPAHTEESK